MLTDPRMALQPYEYQEPIDFWDRQQAAHWLHSEVSMASDLQDWHGKLTDSERELVGRTLKGFAQTEVVVNDYWARKVMTWFPKPEVAMMASAFANMEGIHARAYAYLNESLGLVDFDTFLGDPTVERRLSNLIAARGNSPHNVARSLAVFSGFAEGVQLFSQFAVLMSFQRTNKLKGLGQIVAFSVRDESLHSHAGIWLFNQLCREMPELRSSDLHDDILGAAGAAIEIEDTFIDEAFALGPVDGISPEELKAFVRVRTDQKLAELGYDVPPHAPVPSMDWFNYMTAGVEHQDFFAGRVTTYSKGGVDWSRAFDD